MTLDPDVRGERVEDEADEDAGATGHASILDTLLNEDADYHEEKGEACTQAHEVAQVLVDACSLEIPELISVFFFL